MKKEVEVQVIIKNPREAERKIRKEKDLTNITKGDKL